MLRVLFVEDSESDALLIRRELERGHGAIESTRVARRDELEAALAEPWDVAIVDYRLPGFSGPEALEMLVRAGTHTPAIVVSGTVDEETAASAMRLGARDFVTKDSLARLSPAVAREVRAARRRAAERAVLARSETRYRAVVENSLDLIMIVDADGVASLTNRAFHEALGYTREEIVGRDAFAIVHPDDLDRVRTVFVHGLDNPDAVETAEYRVRAKDGSWHIVESFGRNLVHDPSVRGVLVTSRDLTERRRLEEQLQREQRLDAIGQLAGGIAHDFNNILLVIRGYASLLVEKLAGSESHEKAAAILTATEQAITLTRQLVAFGRRQELRPTALDIADTVRNFETLLRRLLPASIELLVLPAQNGDTIWADVGSFEQVLLNLATNARDAMPEGGVITIGWDEAEVAERDATSVPPLEPGTYMALRVSDTGTGIDPDTMGRLFEPFFTTKSPGAGTGLGLATVHGIMAQSGGGITVDTELGAGTTFTVFFPSAAGRAPTGLAQLPDGPVKEGHERVLLVEDNDGVRVFLEGILRDHGYEVASARRPSEALELASDSRPPADVLVCDVVLPEMSGYDLAGELCSRRPDLRRVFMSGYAGSLRIAERGLEPDVPLLQKPFTPAELLQAVRAVIDA